MILTKLILMAFVSIGAFKAIDLLLLHFTGWGREHWFDSLPVWMQHVLKPVFGCVYCSSTFWGNLTHLALAFTVFGFQTNPFEFVVLWIATTGLIYLIDELININK